MKLHGVLHANKCGAGLRGSTVLHGAGSPELHGQSCVGIAALSCSRQSNMGIAVLWEIGETQNGMGRPL